jgi:hypothetical protein
LTASWLTKVNFRLGRFRALVAVSDLPKEQ